MVNIVKFKYYFILHNKMVTSDYSLILETFWLYFFSIT